MTASRFDFIPTPLVGLTILQRRKHDDSRGFFSRFFCLDELRNAGFELAIQQINHTLTRKKGAVRGMHFQFPPHAEIKMVSCLRGEIYDVAVDVRKNSSTFLNWHGEILSNENYRSIIIPEGFAHGFQALTNDCELLYLHSARYTPAAEGSLNVADPRLAIDWPMTLTDISEKDRLHPFLNEDFSGLSI